jgi:UDP-2-acetamido-3-amino-2,3-dideoxy-glucuronate N-acetyltransferase
MKKKDPSPPTPNRSPGAEGPSVAVIGGGYWGKNLIRNYYNLDALKLIADKSETILSNLSYHFIKNLVNKKSIL